MARRPKPWYRKDRRTWYVTIGGERHNLGPKKKEAFDRFYELMRQPQERKVSPESLPAIIDVFLDWVQKNRAPDTYEWYRYRLQRFAERHPDMRADAVRPYHIQEWVDSYNFSVTSCRNYMRSVKRCLAWAVKQGYLDRNPVEHLEVPAAKAKERVVRQDEFDALLSHVRDGDLRDLLVVTWETGCRPQESLRVEARHVDLEHSRWVFPESEGKTGLRIVYLTEEALAITKRLMLKHPTGALFRNRNGSAWTTDAVNCAFDRVQNRMGKMILTEGGESPSNEQIAAFMKTLRETKRVKGIERKKTDAELRCEAKVKLTGQMAKKVAPRYSLYVLRHSWATHALERGLDALTVAILMGHKDPSMLAKVYQHLAHNPEYLLDQARKAVG